MSSGEENDLEDTGHRGLGMSRGKRMTEEERMLGVFGDSDSDGVKPSSSRRRRNAADDDDGDSSADDMDDTLDTGARFAQRDAGRHGSKYVKPMTFVSSHDANDDNAAADDSDKGDSDIQKQNDGDDYNDYGGGGLGLGFGGDGSPKAVWDNDRAASSKIGSAAPTFTASTQPATAGTSHGVKKTTGVTKSLGLGAFEKHSTGFASRYMEKFGFKGRLGKNEQGITQPIAVQPRPERLGLAYGEFTEASTLPQNREVAQEFFGADHAETRRIAESGEERGGEGRRGEERRGEAKNKKSENRPKPKKEKKVFRTAAEVLAGEGSAATPSMTIIDMRGPQSKVVTSMAEISQAAQGDADVGLGRELKHNLQILTDLAEVELHTSNRKLRAANESVARLEREVAQLQISCTMETLVAEKVASLQAAVKRLAEETLYSCQLLQCDSDDMEARDSDARLLLADTLDAVVDIFQRFPYVMYMHDGLQVLPALLEACLTGVMPSAVFSIPNAATAQHLHTHAKQFLLVLEGLASWFTSARHLKYMFAAAIRISQSEMAQLGQPAEDAFDAITSTAQFTPSTDIELECAQALLGARVPSSWDSLAYELLNAGPLEKTPILDNVLPRFSLSLQTMLDSMTAVCSRHFSNFFKTMMQAWVPQQDCGLLAAAILSVAPTSGNAQAENPTPYLTTQQFTILLNLICTKLSAAVETWDPHRDTVAMTDWLFPWLHPKLLGSTVAATKVPPASVVALLQRLNARMISAMSEWHPSDSSAHDMLAACSQVFDATAMQQLLGRAIIPKLVSCLRQLVINPSEQDVEPLMWTLAWHDLLPGAHMAALLTGEFFPKWLALLSEWAQASHADFDEIKAWYETWKSILPKAILENTSVVQQFHRALDVMEAALEGLPSPVLPPVEETSYESMLAQLRRKSDGHGYTLPGDVKAAPSKVQPTMENMTYSFREVVESAAASRSLALLPNAKRGLVDGNQVYALGDLNVYFAGGVIFVENAKKSTGSKWVPVSLDQVLDMAQS